MSKAELMTTDIKSKIFTIRGQQVMMDRDLAELYGVKTKVLNQAVKRNVSRFPNMSRFQLTNGEKAELVTNCDRLGKMKYSSINPYAFTEQGVAMLSAVLNSEVAIQTSIEIMAAFVSMKNFISQNAGIFQRLESVEQRQIKYQISSDENFDKIFKALEDKTIKPKQGIFYDGQIFDAYTFVCDIIKQAKKSIILIDSYIDETVLTMLAKRMKGIEVIIYTKQTKQLRLDLKKHNQQYPEIFIEQLSKSHDRFLIIDKKTVFHFGASLKDLGKRWFAFSKMEMDAKEIVAKLEK